MFRTNVPVTNEAFRDRQEDLATLQQAMAKLEEGETAWFALIGARKIGKTSLLLELERRARSDTLVFAVLDSYEDRPLSLAIFRRYGLRVVDAFLSREVGASLESLSLRPADYRAALLDSESFARLSRPLRAALMDLPEQRQDRGLVEMVLRLPQQMSEQLDMRCVVAWDEFQELAHFSSGRAGIDVFALARAVWQRHDRVGYLISGSRRSMLMDLVTSPASPFFQHFSILELGPMPGDEATALLHHCAPRDRPIPKDLSRRVVEILGGHPFYLQLFGETLTRTDPPYDDASLKGAMGELLFSSTGRLSLYFQREFDRLVGRASTLAAVLRALCDGPRQLSRVAVDIGAATGSTVRYVERLGDAVVRRDDGLYELADPVFALWLRWRKPGGTVVPMAVVGDEAELAVARALAEMGFELVYQSRASRGAFDLLAVRGGHQLGVQVKRSALPLRFKKTAWNRMTADARRLGWRHTVAAVEPDRGAVRFLDPGAARVARAVTLDSGAVIDNLLAWI